MRIILVLFGFFAGVISTLIVGTLVARPPADLAVAAARADHAIEVTEVGLQPLENLLDEMTYSWKAKMKNASDHPVKLTGYLRIYDEHGFELDHAIETDIYLGPQEERVVSSKGMIKSDLYARAKNFLVEIETR